ncbi:hypothetical protein E2C01_039975 [Portunus trituberculatus]|uniref:Uncharacterized protein n=1 Tax=Portunus trituberculatus TaxID=210409 RepID=A0A5B7FG63_PORTR|nr:hypothetical protein [Portunus trituberculatus]
MDLCLHRDSLRFHHPETPFSFFSIRWRLPVVRYTFSIFAYRDSPRFHHSEASFALFSTQWRLPVVPLHLTKCIFHMQVTPITLLTFHAQEGKGRFFPTRTLLY